MNDNHVSNTSYVSDSSDYVSSETIDAPTNKDLFKFTPFPSLTNIQKEKLEEVLHNVPQYKEEEKTEPVEEYEDETKIKKSCCCLC